jgi:phosphatidylserine/phosphatidylglycerophosphate/cardiolipin synthase-like enzyme
MSRNLLRRAHRAVPGGRAPSTWSAPMSSSSTTLLTALRCVALRCWRCAMPFSRPRAGLTVNIYTKSIRSTDLRPVNQAAYPKLIELIEAGGGIYELDEGQASLHTKCAAIGDACLIVGSYNMDPRSELYDTNNLIVLHEPSGWRRQRFAKHESSA